MEIQVKYHGEFGPIHSARMALAFCLYDFPEYPPTQPEVYNLARTILDLMLAGF